MTRNARTPLPAALLGGMFCACLAAAPATTAAPPATNPTTSATRPATQPGAKENAPARWLEQAEAEAGRVDDQALRAFLREQIVLTYGRVGDVKGAAGAVGRLPRAARPLFMEVLAVQQATGGDFPGALATARSIRSAEVRTLALADLAAIRAPDAPDEAGELAELLPEPHRSSALLAVVEHYVAAGNLKAARKAGRKLVAGEYRKIAANYILAGEVAADNKSLKTAITHAVFDREEFEYGLAVIAMARARSGRFAQARKLVEQITWPGQRACVHIEVARAQLARGGKAEFTKTIRIALGEIKADGPSEDQIMLVLSAAELQVQAGQFDAAEKTILRVWARLERWDIGHDPALETAAELLLKAGRNDRVAKLLAKRKAQNVMHLYGVVKALAAHYAAERKGQALDALLKSLAKPADRAEAYLGVAKGLHARREKAKTK